MDYDAVVVGLGAMGSAAIYQLAKSGAAVLGIDRYSPPHTFGSTHGDTRITRLAVGEGIEYVPLVRRSHEIWREVETESDIQLLHQCGGLIMAVRGSQGMHGADTFLEQTVATAEKFAIAHSVLTANEISERFPQFALVGSEEGYEEPAAGYLRPERCVEAQLLLARRYGAKVAFGDRVTSYADDGTGVKLQTTGGPVTARKMIITAGPWIDELVPEIAGYTKIYRQVLFWFELKDRSQFDLYQKMPVYIWEFGRGRDELIYGFPMIDGPAGGAKVAREDYTAETSVDMVRRDVTEDEIESMYEDFVKDRLPALGGRCIKTRSCLYTVTPDSRFIIDFHPANGNVVVASPCSGHGFKHSAAIGECLAQLVTTGSSAVDISMFRFPSRDTWAR